MRKLNTLLAVLLCVLCVSPTFAVSKNKTSKSVKVNQLGDAGIDDGSSASVSTTSVSSSSSDSTASKSDTELTGKGYVGGCYHLNLREGPWGNVITVLDRDDEVNIVKKEGDWYKISSPKDGYVSAKYIFAQKGVTAPKDDVLVTTSVMSDVPGDSIQAKVVNAAKELVSKYSKSGSFPYAAATKGGRLGCAQVATTALKAAGVLNQVNLGCVPTKGLLKQAGWTAVKAPPYQAGDVIFWSTYDRNKDGKKDPDTHIGIIMSSGNNVQAMSNSSSQKKPRIHNANYAPVTTVMRKC